MGLFDLLGEVVAAPLKLTATAAKTVVKTTGHALAGNLEKAGDALDEAAKEAEKTVDKVCDALDE